MYDALWYLIGAVFIFCGALLYCYGAIKRPDVHGLFRWTRIGFGLLVLGGAGILWRWNGGAMQAFLCQAGGVIAIVCGFWFYRRHNRSIAQPYARRATILRGVCFMATTTFLALGVFAIGFPMVINFVKEQDRIMVDREFPALQLAVRHEIMLANDAWWVGENKEFLKHKLRLFSDKLGMSPEQIMEELDLDHALYVPASMADKVRALSP